MPARRTVTEINVANLYRRQDVRDELQILRKRIKARLAKHQAEAGDGPKAPPKLFAGTHSPFTCKECWKLSGAIEAIDEAIRMFGGREAQAGKNRPEYLNSSPVERSEAPE